MRGRIYRALEMFAATILLGLFSTQFVYAEEIRGCFLVSGAQENWLTKARIYEKTSDSEFNSTLGRALVRMAKHYEVSPGFAFFRGEGSYNAIAMSDQLKKFGRKDGTVLLGKGLMDDLKDEKDDGISLLAILGHEFAHIIQYKKDLHQELVIDGNVKLLELHADYLAGFYLALIKERVPEAKVRNSGQLFESLGDTSFGSPYHHGTPKERLEALEKGYFDFVKGESVDINSAIEKGTRYVAKNFSN